MMGADHIDLGRDGGNLFWPERPGKAERLADAPLHICRVVEVFDARSLWGRRGENHHTFLFQLVQSRKIVRVQPGHDGHAYAEALERDAAEIDRAAGGDFAVSVNHIVVLRKVADHQDVKIRIWSHASCFFSYRM